nr:outer membrane beta-barrel protein [uncultured Holophaga sp.]
MSRLLSLLTASILCVSAQAGDTWTGGFAGLSFGRTQTTVEQQLASRGTTLRAQSDAWNKGFQLGYDWQLGTTVLGLEYTRSLGTRSLGTSLAESVTSGGVTTTTTGSSSAQVKRLETLRLRAGLALGSTLVYLTGGAGRLDTTAGWVQASSSSTGDSSTVAVLPGGRSKGLVVGVGLEQRLGSEWSFRVEYLSFRTSQGTEASVESTDASASVAADLLSTLSTFQVGLNYRF